MIVLQSQLRFTKYKSTSRNMYSELITELGRHLHDRLMTCADGSTAVKSVALEALDASLGGLITEFVSLHDFSGKAVSFRDVVTNPRA